MKCGITDSVMMMNIANLTPNCNLDFLISLFEQIIELVVDESVVSETEFDSHLEEKLIPNVKGLYRQSQKVKATLEDLITDIVEAVRKGHSQDDVCTYLQFPTISSIMSDNIRCNKYTSTSSSKSIVAFATKCIMHDCCDRLECCF